MCGQHTALVSAARYQVKVELLRIPMFINKAFVDNAPRGWVSDTSVIRDKETLMDPLVNDHDCYARLGVAGRVNFTNRVF